MNIFQEYLSYGLSVIPCEGKIPIIPSWKSYQSVLPTMIESDCWIGNIACICGAVSGGLICVDFDIKNGDRWGDWLKIINEQYPELLSKLVMEQTPSGGYHVIFRSSKIIKNIKLAMNIDNKATIETRGEGGYFVCAPSVGYQWYYGNMSTIQKLTDEETEIILSTAASLNEVITEDKQQPLQQFPKINGDLTPFDDYNSSHDIVGLLQSHGWKMIFQRGEVYYFQRPGKEGRGISATWNAVPDRFYVFSTATNFENNHIYKASAVYAILEHGGNWSEAARALAANGYGKKIEQQPRKAALIDNSDIKNKLLTIKKQGYKKGYSTGWKNLDEYYTVIKGQLTVVTGMPSHGKSQFVDAMMINLADIFNWKFVVFSPENYPVEMHYHQLIEKYSGIGFWKLSDADIIGAINFIQQHFYFVDGLEEEINLDSILDQTQELINNNKIDALLLDPWNEIELSKPKELSTTEYIGVCLRKCRKFARKNTIHLWIVAHPIKMQKDKEGKYPIPELYDIEGSAHWRNKADNGICVFRDLTNDITKILIQKIKYRYTGKPGSCELKFNAENGRYEESMECSSFVD